MPYVNACAARTRLNIGVVCLCTALLADQWAGAAIRHVDASATGGNNGTSWPDAFTSLQSALSAAVSGDEIWVAAATYRPAGPNGPRTSTFQVKDGTALYSGFPVGGGTFAQRDPDAHVTTISGDLNADDGPNSANDGENIYHAVSTTNLSAATVLDGVVVTAGNADGVSADSQEAEFAAFDLSLAEPMETRS